MMVDGWIAVAAEDELSPGQMKRVEAGGRRMLLCNADGRHYVVDEMCSHEDYSLFLGCIQEGRIKCSLHGSYFDLKTGKPETEPAYEPICSYPVRIKDRQIWVLPGKQE
ncbi:non-heme iron oxygenase ferredoxin subunit [Thiolapillus sp.]|uniref:non-heme iron oxygenase ferredoxin subunit n=2 Tax=Thiolapillus sp. TaxID=2017437 RepID=UPI0025CE9A6A|nr:non-heme iron oxygenase ferredoxin subunit [Thiolapillus sp.]